jgi:hypothetical protein
MYTHNTQMTYMDITRTANSKVDVSLHTLWDMGKGRGWTVASGFTPYQIRKRFSSCRKAHSSSSSET